ncbi:MAG: peptide deformylase [Proteobacteria bacterium]|nr:peptide deformylase [Pseudomonadota bacterium]
MSKLKVVIAPDPRLKKVAKIVETVDKKIQQLLKDMLETMYKTNGIGLAAPQVGISKRLVVIDISYDKDGNDKSPIYFINPEITKLDKELSIYNEGCLSLPNIFEDVERPATCSVKALDFNGEEFSMDCDELLATCIQHEIDHLDGIVFADHLSRLKRNRILTKLEKSKKRKDFSEELFEI